MICIISFQKIIRSWLLCVTTIAETRRRSQSDWRTFHEIKQDVNWVIAMNERNDLISITAIDWLRKTKSMSLYELAPERLYAHDKKCLTQHLVPRLIQVSGHRKIQQISEFASHWHAVLGLVDTTFQKGKSRPICAEWKLSSSCGSPAVSRW